MGGELFTLFAKLTLDTSEFDNKAEKSTEKASVFADVLKANLVGKGISLAVDGLKKLGSAAKGFIGDAVDAYGSVEQLRGGIETLFGDSAQKVMADADQAFKTAGMNAADYMETSIQSAASLINSLGGDQAKAAELMNMSITDMADNVNKMGTSMEGVQNAYRGFSRGNFTMLDNLALGFAGTKEGMQELLDKAEEISGIKYDISSYSDIVEAIHVVQTEMDITGTTAREASGTIQGSLNAMKSAWDNLVAGIADPDADMSERIGAFAETTETAFNNIVPAVERGLETIVGVVSQAAPIIAEKLPEMAGVIIPAVQSVANEIGIALYESINPAEMADKAQGLFEAGLNLVMKLGEGIRNALPGLIEQALPIVLQFTEGLRANTGKLVDTGIDFVYNIAQGIMDSLPTLIEQIPQIVINIAGVINDNAPKLLVAGGKLILMIIDGIANAIPALIDNFPKIFEMIMSVWQALNWANLGKSVITFITNGVKSLASNIPAALKQIGNNAMNMFKTLDWKSLGTNVIVAIVNALTAMFGNIPDALKSIGNEAWNAFTNIDWYSIGSNIISGIANGIWNGAGRIVDAAKGAARNALSAAKDFLGIKSPSRVFRKEVGEMIGEGMALGINDSEDSVDRAIRSLNSDMFKGLNNNIDYSPQLKLVKGERADGGKNVNVIINSTVSGAENPEDYATRLVRELELQMRTA